MYTLKNALKAAGKVFIDGAMVLLPITVTFGIFSLFFAILKRCLAPLAKVATFFVHIPHGEIIVMVVMVLLAGLFLKTLVVKSVLELIEQAVNKTPIISPVYAGIKQLVHAFSPSDHTSFKQVVLVEFPHKGVYGLGFVTTEANHTVDHHKEQLYNIFVPTTPNPIHGFFLMVKANEFMPIDLSTQEAMALIISGGIIQPERLKRTMHD